MRSLVPLALLAAGCFSEPAHPSCPDGTELLKQFGQGTTKGMGCMRKLPSGHKEGLGWQLSFFDRGVGYFGPDQAHADNLLIVCIREDGTTSMSPDEVGRLMRSTTINPTCLDKPLQPVWQQFSTELTAWYVEHDKLEGE